MQMTACRELFASPADVLGAMQKSVEQAVKVSKFRQRQTQLCMRKMSEHWQQHNSVSRPQPTDSSIEQPKMAVAKTPSQYSKVASGAHVTRAASDDL